MSVFDRVRRQRTATDGARRIRISIQSLFEAMEATLHDVHSTYSTYGRAAVEQVLDGDASEVNRLYQELRTLMNDNVPDANVEDLPS